MVSMYGLQRASNLRQCRSACPLLFQLGTVYWTVDRGYRENVANRGHDLLVSWPNLEAEMTRLRWYLPFALGALLALSAQSFAAPKAYTHEAVIEDLAQRGQTRVIVVMWSNDLPTARAKDWRQRGPAIGELARRVRSAVPGLSAVRTYETEPFLAATVDAESLRQLQQSPDVEGIYPVHTVKAALRESGPLIGRPQAEAAGYAGHGVTVAVLDSGVDYENAMLGGGSLVTFGDVKPGFWAWRYIEAIAIAGVTTGFADGTYQPAGSVTRDQMAAYVARALAGGDANVRIPPSGETPRFSDIPSTFWAFKYIQYIADPSLDIVSGFPDGTYQPGLVVDRGTMSAYIARSLVPGGDAFFDSYSPPNPGFSDISSTDWFYKYVAYLKAHGIVNGYADGRYHPELSVSRDQMAKFVANAFDLAFPGAVVGGVNLLQPADSPLATNPLDDNGHGTWVAGIVASRDATWRGIAPAATLVAIKVLDSTGAGTSDVIMAGIDWAIQHRQDYNIRVANLSLAEPVAFSDPATCDGFPEAQVLADAVANGIVVVVAAGNDGFTTGISFPACVSSVISVGATGDGGPAPSGQAPVAADAVAGFSDAGELLSIYAPGAWITGAALGGGLVVGAGTSGSAPHVSGAVADIISKGSVTTPAAVRQLLTRTGKQVIDPRTGVATPRVDLTRAISPPTNLPDLVVTAVSGAANGVVGNPVNLSITVKNEGDQASAACTAIIVLSQNTIISPQDAVLAVVDVPALSAGASRTVAVNGTVPPLPVGVFWIGGYGDSGYGVAELDETNNSRLGAQMNVTAP